jgi:hypothetical protein
MSKIQSILIAGLIAIFGPESVIAAQDQVTIKQIGAAFFEAPPDKENILVPMNARLPISSSSTQVKVETHAVVIAKNRLMMASWVPTSTPTVKASAILLDDSSVSLGFAEVPNFRPVSDDQRKTLISMRIRRLPDKPVKRVVFSGTVRISVAKGISHKIARFDPGQEYPPINIGAGAVTMKAINSKSVLISGGEEVSRIAGVKITRFNDSVVLKGARGPFFKRFGREGNVFEEEWVFNESIAAGEIDISVYDGADTMDLPVQLTVNKPY